MEHTPRGGSHVSQWFGRFQRSLELSLPESLASEEDQGSLRDMRVDRREKGIWVTVAFSMASRPGVVFERNQNVVPDLSADWDPEFAAMLFRTHLIEWYHTEAKRRPPAADGVVRD
ncbi:hypothetical protein SAMN05428945_3387 [Streptomyces sp. 2224.1]|uniref:hypothetical protein n=1 Tax=unclassified Streptomyces TaxID=2593676 RepID=UPI00087FEC6F|nr:MULTISPECIES: hypothetical protein [unclassified Streptomyces]PBC82057.1 hypothetical protein BX261_1939 [Streptomyces sp. 2321.6]SDR51705.1 hypothetical protein SAMN05216511_5275 [Streptomyces sp. KS_16]SEC41769.1 hypothetical protein SAMN05428940_1941 [Streptomyces sp. 2133.1]SEC61637.1 hypothetical protein SAMN05428945_3387 [Streptomyces sp. 2224.1]SEF02334.1 hypothetical protein SAMN05428954_5333 [Streptomyces sp. 2112.3]